MLFVYVGVGVDWLREMTQKVKEIVGVPDLPFSPRQEESIEVDRNRACVVVTSERGLVQPQEFVVIVSTVFVRVFNDPVTR